MEDDICGDIKININEESTVVNETHRLMENEESITQMEVNISGVKVDQDLPLDFKGNGTNDVIQSNKEQNSDVRILNSNILQDMIDKSVEEIITESDDVRSNQSTGNSDEPSFDSNLQNHKATILHHIDNAVSHNKENSTDRMDGHEAAETFIIHSELIIEDIKTEGSDNLDDGTCDENVYKKLLGTSEELLVSVKREDLLKLQKTFKEERCLRSQEISKRWKSFPCKLCSFAAKHRFDLLAHIAGIHKDLAIEMKILPLQNMFPGREPHQIWYRCTDCAYISKEKSYLVRHLLIHKELHEVETFSCASCSYITKLKVQLIDHMEKHKEEKHKEKLVSLKCPYCYSFFRNNHYLKRHIKFLHKADKLEKLKCTKCPYETVYRNAFQGHLLTHNKSRKLYMCPLCPFKTPNKSTLRNSHNLLHKNDEETRKYQCAHCEFKGKTRDSIIRHLLVHQRPGAAVMHKCDKCSFQTKHKCHIRRHQQVHQDLHELDLVPCSLCPYQGRTKDHLRTHMKLKHTNPDDIKIYSCEYCPYQSRSTSDVKRHNRNAHTLSKDITFHHCSICVYKAKSEYEVKQHFKRVHEKPPKEVKWYKCDECGLQFRQKWVLRRHISGHKDSGKTNSSESAKRNLFYCHHCPYSTKRKDDLKRHVPMHNNVFLKCDKCDFQTRYRSCMLRHKKTLH